MSAHNRKLIRICFVIDNLSPAGTEMQLLLLLRHLDRGKIKPFLCLLNGTDYISRALEPKNIPVLRLGLKRLVSSAGVKSTHLLFKYLKKNKIDFVQTYFIDSTRFAAPIAKLAGCKVLGAKRNIGHWMSRKDIYISRFYNRYLIDQIIANCDATRNSVVESEWAKSDKVVVIPNGVELEIYEDIPVWSPKSNTLKLKVGMVGNLRKVKGPDIFIKAAKIIFEKSSNIGFEIAGGGGKKTYQVLIDSLGLKDVVKLRGFIKDIPEFLTTLDIAILPSRAEGLSGALIEYMAAGRPIIATKVGGNNELIQHNRNGLLVESENVEAIAEAMWFLICKPDQAKSLAIAAKDDVNRRFGAQILSDSYVENLKCILS